ncbi:MAG TPA: putative sugar nucleotidyl transferase [Candidatus Bathyarchaeia archaeon]|nr:putative sugar nucleotidyl transferase [Candidatus Bathyarchaeia archaeon]
MILALFEDQTYENFLPITYIRPVYECRTGMFTLLERTQHSLQASRLICFTRKYLAPTLRKRITLPVNEPNVIEDDLLLINGTLILDQGTKQLIQKKITSNTLMMQNGRVAAAHLSQNTAQGYADELCTPLTSQSIKKLSRNCKQVETSKLPLLTYPWELVNHNAELIKRDYTTEGKNETEGTIDSKATVYGKKTDVHVGKNSFIEAHVTLDARSGPIYVGNGTNVQSGSRITGPAYIGDKVTIASGLLREGCSIGPVCRIGGELEETIIQGYTNKYHTGFIGHAYIGEWVNIGAATTNSDLKNTYGNIQVDIQGKNVDTATTKVGCFIGDHAKTSIGTQIYTGKKIGIASHVHGFVTKDVPSFTIWSESLGSKPAELYLKSAIETQKRVMARRNVKQSKEDIELLTKLFEITAPERKKSGVARKKFAF